MRKSYAVYEVMLASVVASSTIYVYTLQMMARYWVTIEEPHLDSVFSCLFAFLVWIGLLLWVRRLPHRIFVFYLSRGRVRYPQFDLWRERLDSHAWTLLAYAVAAAGFLLMLRPLWDPRPMLLGLPVMWLLSLRRLLALPEPTDPRYRFSRLNVSKAISDDYSDELHRSEIEAAEAEEDWRRR